MMDPSMYRAEEERYEAAERIRRERQERLAVRKRIPAAKKRCLCTREVLPSGCILITPKREAK